VFPQLDEDQLRDVLRILGVSDDPVTEAVDLRRLPADELLEGGVVAAPDRLDQLPVVGFQAFLGGDHQAEFRGHRHFGTRPAWETSIPPETVLRAACWVLCPTKARRTQHTARRTFQSPAKPLQSLDLCAYWSSGRVHASTRSPGSSASPPSSKSSTRHRATPGSRRSRTASTRSAWPTSSSWPTSPSR